MNQQNTTSPHSMNRRSFLGRAATLGAIVSVPWTLTSQTWASSLQQQLNVRPRSDWDEGHGPTGPIEAEDPRFLLVHHTAVPGNDYTADDVPGLLRSMYWFHSGEEKGWPDIAYNFLVDRYGTIWEGRAGSIAGPVQGSATGGNQGFSQLCCFIGNLSETDPTPAATASMVNLLAWLAIERNIDVSKGATTSFVSRGSSVWPVGSEVTTPTIAGHRDMSQTTCPGDRGYAFVTGQLPALVLAKVSGTQPTEPETTTTTESVDDAEISEPATSDPTDEVSASPESTTTSPPAQSTDPATPSTSSAGSSELDEESLPAATEAEASSSRPSWIPFAAVGGVAVAAQGVAIAKRRPTPDSGPGSP